MDRHNVLIHRAALAPRVVAMPGVYAVSHLFRWVVPVGNSSGIFNRRGVSVPIAGGG